MPSDARDHEKEYFHQQEKEKLRKLKDKTDREKAETERARLRTLHHLRCGKCGQLMATQDFKGVEIEVCPDCGAVLLDPGELELLAGRDKSSFASTLGELFSFSKSRGKD